MLSRRTLGWLLAGAFAPGAAYGQPTSGGPLVALYASIGEELVHFDLDRATGALTRRGSVTLPANVQYAVPDPAGRVLYVASSTGGGGGADARHHLSAFRVEPGTGALTQHGAPAALPLRPINIDIDRDGRHVVVVFNEAARVVVHRVGADGTLGDPVPQPAAPAEIVYAHQVRVAPSNALVLVCGRGNDAAAGKPEDLGTLTSFAWRDGVATPTAPLVLPAGAGPRHLDFHPSLPLAYVAIERGNQLHTYALEGGALGTIPLVVTETLADPARPAPSQRVGAIHVHPTGRFLYLTNRADRTVTEAGQAVLAGGENTLAVYALDGSTGVPTLVGRVDTGGIEPRTFTLDRAGTWLVVANQKAGVAREGAGTLAVPAGLAVFRIGTDGMPALAHKAAIDAGAKPVFWCGFVERA